MKKILLLEDDKTRIDKVKQATIGHNLHVATTAKEAIDFLSQLRAYDAYDIISLDHDLNGTEMSESNEYSGYAVAQYIVNMSPILWPRTIIVHTFNQAGGLNIMNELFKTQEVCLTSGPVYVVRASFDIPEYWRIFE